ncbi:hypothetical protein EHS25_004884 [Saitozyma podzolica]|uniref:Uncharacterized protein n=1 Tax=Saitozyma podzolica TaxID=1890683 RepID=A0A427Y2Y9_9TREE|nr:hypothetical protein EHS25_004884 [Saitozyma podzolica]
MPGGITSEQGVPPRVPRSSERQIEDSSVFPAGDQVAIVIPFSPALRFTDFEVSAALHARPLLPGAAATRTIETALPTLDGVQVHLEPLITGTQRRNDIRITGSAARGLSNEDIDIHSLLGLAGFSDCHPAAGNHRGSEDDPMAERTAKRNGAGTPPRTALSDLMTRGVYSLLVRKLSLGSLRARARCFEP